MEQLTGMMKTVSILIYCLCLVGGTLSYAQEKTVRYKLSKQLFNLKEFNAGIPDTTGKIDTTKLYYVFDSRPTLSAKNGKYLMLKFHNNGTVQLFADTVLSHKKVKTLQPGLPQNDFDYYVIENKNDIKMEMYRDAITDKGWWTGKVYKNKIAFSKVNNTRQSMVFVAWDQ